MTTLSTHLPPKQLPTLSRSSIASQIVNGRLLIISSTLFPGQTVILDLTTFAKHHPGGELAILHFVGRDAGDEIDAYHEEAVRRRMKGFVVGRVGRENSQDQDDAGQGVAWTPLLPPISLGLIRDTKSPTGWRREGAVLLGEERLLPGTTSDEEKEDKDDDGSSTLIGSDSEDIDKPSIAKRSTATILTSLNTDFQHDASLYPILSPSELEPPPQSTISVQQERARTLAYRKLRTKMVENRMFTPMDRLSGYGPDLVRYGLLGGLAFFLYMRSSSSLGYMLSAIFLGAFWHQLTFLAHDAGHTGVTGNTRKDYLIGILVADWIGGLSLGWWKDNHNIHHLVTNHPEHDPDIQHIPFFAISPKFFGSLWSTYYKRVMEFDGFSRVMIGFQHQIYYVVLSLGRFNLYANSYGFLAIKARRNFYWKLEVAGVVFFWAWFGALLWGLPSWRMRLAYLLVSHIVTSPVHVQIVLSHFARSTDDLGPTESFVSRQLRTTMDVICSPAIEFFHGGLHLQVTHHLFPRIPRHNLRKASLLVKEFCKEQEMEYAEYGFIEGNQRVLSTLKSVADQLKLLKTVAAADARGEIH